ncbi:MAG: 8-amino-7-oxononanoate synthase [Pseudomonadota bacterium]|nr:8-amino-7-oxononanoate synthase [Pseudomonadota bacterium]
MKNLHALLQQRRTEGLYRSRRTVESPQGAEIVVDGKTLLNFCSNDYLGLANHPDIKKAFIAGAEKYGTGSGAAHLICGHSTAHHALEEELAEFSGYPRALLFSTGYMANLGVAQALCGRGDRVFEDRLNHASLLDAALLSGARLQRYQHNNPDDLQHKLSEAGTGEKLVMTDAVFSMDGDIAPLPQLATICQAADAWLMMDDAHGIGVLGKHGCGSAQHFGLGSTDVPVYMATLGKALGTAGAFVAGSDDLIEYLIQSARTYVYTTAMPPALAEAARASLRIACAADDRREHLQQLIRQFRAGAQQLGLQLMDSATAIQPILAGETAAATRWSQRLLEQGILVSAIRPPTVPAGTARLRITFSANHTREQVNRLLDALNQLT